MFIIRIIKYFILSSLSFFHKLQYLLLILSSFLSSSRPNNFLLSVFDPADFNLSGDSTSRLKVHSSIGEALKQKISHSAGNPAITSSSTVFYLDSVGHLLSFKIYKRLVRSSGKIPM